MKIITTILFTFIISQSSNAEQFCADYITDEWPDSRYTIEILASDNVVTDKKTGLMWKQCAEGLSGVNCLTGTTSTHNWQQALAIPDTLNTTGFAEFTDWRLPNIEELRSIAAMNCFLPAINVAVFPNTDEDIPSPGLKYFWSSSPYANIANYAWFISFDVGESYTGDDTHFNRDQKYRVRLVRSVQ